MASRQSRSRSIGTDEFTLLAEDLRWPDHTPDHDTEDKGKGVENVEPEFNCSKFSIVSLGEFRYSEYTSDLESAKVGE